MSKYFSKFPKLIYTRQGVSNLATDILTRIDTIKGVLDNTSLFYTYSIQEGDTPEMIASKYYGDSELHWIVLIFNEIIDPFYDWPMHYRQFIIFLTDKYGSPATAQMTNHHYEKIITSIDGYTGRMTTDVYQIDLDSYNHIPAEPTTETKVLNNQTITVTTSRRSISCYDYENELNESKRVIKLIKNNLVPDIKNQFEILMSA
jgi:hypothetical protein